ncbi:ATP-binding protein [Desulfosporosinus sp. HMP52]|uniref:ATP-binding protein n=1 Tax=Desulfosporosinus sp. HMP52 TaxID=1487923 RepID=UPI00068A8626|nr:ATP-binding protein [Desulfosporosinus sp. HMP52]
MLDNPKFQDNLLYENIELKRQLDEANSIIKAIRSNELNSLVFEKVASPLIVCDQIGKVVKKNLTASMLFRKDLNDGIFDTIIPLYNKVTGERFLVQEAIKKEPVCNQEVVFDGDVHLIVNASYLQGEQTNSGFFLISIVDITENYRYREEIRRLDRLNLVGEMAAGIGHEVRNPMTTVRGYLQIFQGKDQFSEYKESISIMIEELDRANSIITEFLSLAKTKELTKQEINFNEIINKIIPLVEVDALRQGLEIRLELQDVPNILGDEKEIRQCILNLVKNGLEAMLKGGAVTVKTYSNDSWVILEIKDQGCGIPVEVQNSMGKPFLTTKEQGTGLGLSVCFSIAKRHGAVLDFKTDQRGTSFYLKCPTIA